MENISADNFTALTRSCKILERDGYGEKVLLSDDNQIIKIFRRKRLLSSALLFPYAHRFATNAKQLLQRGIPTVIVTRLGRCRQLKRDLVWYQLLPGKTLRDYCQQQNPQAITSTLGTFVATLHQRGVLFRSLHWGNVIVQPDGTLGLIDIADLKFQRRPLTLGQRTRNFRHMLRYPADQELFTHHADAFWSAYFEASELNEKQGQKLRKKAAQ